MAAACIHLAHARLISLPHLLHTCPRSLSNYQCRRPQYYVPLQSQECTTVVNGWLSAQSVCAPVLAPGMYDLFRAAQANTSSQSGYFYWDYNSQNAYSGFCNAVAGEAAPADASLQNWATSFLADACMPCYCGLRLLG